MFSCSAADIPYWKAPTVAMPAHLGNILADPDRTIVGTGSNALVITRRHTDENGRELSPAERAAANSASGDAGRTNPLNPLEKASRNELSEAEREVVRELKDRDRDVRQHEQKHLAAAGGLAKGGPRYHYQIGPDGKPYAVGGEVQIDTSPVPGNPEATRNKAEQIRRAALAPGDASGPDLAVAQSAAAIPGQTDLENHAGKLESHASREYRQNDAAGLDAAARPRHELRLFA